MSNLKRILDEIKIFQVKSGLPILQNTSVVSPMYPGNFCFCLDEIHWYEKYHDFVKVEISDDFQKNQPAIRLEDFNDFYLKSPNESFYHLGLFTIATIDGARVISASEGKKVYLEMMKAFVSFFSGIGLDLSRLKVTYFSGNTAKEIEASRKKEHYEKKILVEDYILEDPDKEALLDFGINLEGNNTRDNYLTSNWYDSVAPWGYRNEFLYAMPDGKWLDIGTIENLATIPIVEKIGGKNHVVRIENWGKAILINGVGLERILMAVEEAPNISQASIIQPLDFFPKINPAIREALRICHRVFTHVSWGDIRRKRKKHLKALFRLLKDVEVGVIRDFLYLHAETYRMVFPDLSSGIDKTLDEIKAYWERRK